MVAQVTLTHPVLVRIQARQPLDAPLRACSWPAAGSAEVKRYEKNKLPTRRVAPSKRSASRDVIVCREFQQQLACGRLGRSQKIREEEVADASSGPEQGPAARVEGQPPGSL